jgi:hypothetical protein
VDLVVEWWEAQKLFCRAATMSLVRDRVRDEREARTALGTGNRRIARLTERLNLRKMCWAQEHHDASPTACRPGASR